MSSRPNLLRALRCSQRSISFGSRRLSSTKLSAERVSVPCQSNGSIFLDLHYPPPGLLERNSSTTVLIYLPVGPFAHAAERDASNIAVLRSCLRCPIAQVNYRLDNEHKYPMPVHDVLSGFDWIIDNLLPKRGITRVGRSESVGQVAVCGEHIGGSLATALALTECRLGQPGVIASAVSNPLVDWISLHDGSIHQAGRMISKKPILVSDEISTQLGGLRALRARLFQKPENYFDPFASPILFFRSAGVEVPPPPEEIPLNDLEQLSLLEREQCDRQALEVNNEDSNPINKPYGSRNPAPRKASRRFPSKALGLRLPQFRISTATTSPLREQAGELAHVLRQSFVRQSKDAIPGHSEFGRKVLMDDEMDEEERTLAAQWTAEAAKKVELHVEEGRSGWSDDAHGKANLAKAAMWLREKLE